ncbi:hypothetical protein GLOIN_2v1885507 [Rhizophagus irregularis DAOM 181602=DAOM 197198]|nr:hypothetical protein GLOIN_2v1885507 [Rhizophagus irregularis DAOM 181602=DAOM 197198]
MGVEQAYLDLLNSNFALRKELILEETNNISNKEKIRKLTKEIEACERYIFYLEKNLVSREDEIDQLKAECQSTLVELGKYRDHLELKEEALVAQDERIIQLEDTVDKLKKCIQELSLCKGKIEMDEDNELFNPILRILDRRRAVADCVSEIRLFFDRNRIPIPQDIDDVFNATTQSLDEIIRQAALMQEIGVDQLNQIEGLQTLLGESLDRTNALNQDLIRVRDDFTYETNARRHWETVAQQNQARIAGIQIANLGIRFLNRRKDAQLANQQNQLVNQQNQIANQQNQIAEHRRNAHRLMLRYNADTERWRRRHAGCIRQAQNWQRQYRISQTQVQAQAQNILNLQQQILALQNNPPNMATIQDVMHTISPGLAQLPFYDGQEPPDSYYQKLRAVNEMARPLAVAVFNAAMRCSVMKNKMSGRFIPVPANNPYNANAAINTEPEFLNWLQGKYRDVMVGTNQGAIIALMNESFSPIDTPDTYAKRIRSLAQGQVYAEILPYLYNHLPDVLEMRVRIAAPADLDAFFNELRNKWYESGGRKNPTTIVEQPQNRTALEKLADIAVRLGYTGDITNPVAIHTFIESDLTRKLGGQTQHLRKDHFGTGQVKKVTKTTKSSPKRHCSNCGRTGHSKNKCSRSKRTKKVNNTHIVDYEESESDEKTDEETEEELTEEEEEEDEPQNCFSKTDEVFHAALKSIIASLAVQCPKEILLQINAYTNQAYENLKDPLLNHFVSDYPVSERKKLWDVLSANMQDILSPLAHAVNTATPLLPTPPADVPSEVEQKEDKTLNHAIRAYQQKNLYWPRPLEINFLQLDDPNDVATISCKIKNVCIPYAMIDTGSDSSVISENVAKHLGLKIDRKNIHALNGVAGSTKTLGTINEIPITIGEGTNTVTISDEFSVIPTEKDRNGKDKSLLILGTQWQYRAGWEPVVKGEFKANVNGQVVSIPLSVHKAQRNVFAVDSQPAYKKN